MVADTRIERAHRGRVSCRASQSRHEKKFQLPAHFHLLRSLPDRCFCIRRKISNGSIQAAAMRTSSTLHVCPVCGYDELRQPPRNRSGFASLEICPSCGFQFGVTDEIQGFTHDEHRRRWIDSGMPWSSKSQESRKDWNAQTQLGNLALSASLRRVRGRPPRLFLNRA